MITRNTRVALITLIILIVAITAYFLAQGFWLGDTNVPEEFVEARVDGAVTARKIVFLAHQSLAGLEQISQFDEKKNYSSALKLVAQELKRNSEARKEAVVLSNQLGTMATLLSAIEPVGARTLATEAVGYEVQLVNHLISYHETLNELFELLRGKFEGRIHNSEHKVKKLVGEINNEIKIINKLNQKFDSSMERFDKYFD
jgi:hypothetical protein